jgi:hypothetical protein
MSVSIKAIKPKWSRGYYQAEVVVDIDGQEASFDFEMKQVLDYRELQAAIASRCGHLLRSEKNQDWGSILNSVWKTPEPPPEGDKMEDYMALE